MIHAATERPAAVLGLEKEIGTLRPGALADVALFQIVDGEFMFYDVLMNPRPSQQLIPQHADNHQWPRRWCASRMTRSCRGSICRKINTG